MTPRFSRLPSLDIVLSGARGLINDSEESTFVPSRPVLRAPKQVRR
jgi:hypothetical protein